MIISKNNWEDVKKYFDGTYVKFKEEGELVYKIIRVSPNELVAQDKDGNKVKVDLNKKYNLDYILPKKTVYQQGEHAFVLERIPKRMWCKGVSDQNTRLQVLQSYGWEHQTLTINNFSSFVGKQAYYTFDQAVNNFVNGGSLQSAALSSRISINREGTLYVDTVKVGKFNYKEKTLVLKKVFIPALSHLFTCKVQAL